MEDQPVVISIVTHNSQHLFETLDYLYEEIGTDPKYHIKVYNNASSGQYRKRLDSYMSWLTVIDSEENHGFGYGHNQNLCQETGTYAVICNPDILVTKKTLNALEQEMIHRPNSAAIVPKVLNPDGSTQHLVRDQLSILDYFLRFLPKKIKQYKKIDQRLARYECRQLPEDRVSQIRMGSGCFLWIDLQKYQEIGGFDEQFFMYFEDNDLCLRYEEAGYSLWYTPFETVIHYYGQGAHHDQKLFRIFITSMVKFFNKWGWRWK